MAGGGVPASEVGPGVNRAAYRTAHGAGARGEPLPSDLGALGDHNVARAHGHGKAGKPFDTFEPTEAPAADQPEFSAPPNSQSGPRASRGSAKSRKAPSKRRPTPKVPRVTRPSALRPLGTNVPVGVGPGMSIGGLLVGAVAYAILLSVVEYGTAGPGMWFKAKFLNNATGSSSGGVTSNQAAPASSGSQVLTPTGPGGTPGDVLPAGSQGLYNGPGPV